MFLGGIMENSYTMVIQRLIEYRIAKGYSQDEMAELLGLTQSHYCKIELGKKVITNETLLKKYEIGMDIDYLITGQETKYSSLDNIVEKCPLGKRTFFMNIIISYINVWLKNNGESLLFCQKELEILKFRIDKENGQNNGTVWECIRKINNISQEKMTDILDVDRKTYRKIEKGTSMPNVELLTNLYNALGYYPSLITDIETNYLYTVNRVWEKLPKESQDKVEDIIVYNLDYMNEKL